jgi:sugar phosphate isomerase/epimerase
MRLGGYFTANTVGELEALCDRLDCYGLSAIHAPARLAEMNPDACAMFGERAHALDIVIGEAGMWENLLTTDRHVRARRIDRVRQMLENADLMGCRCVVTLVGTKDPSDHPLAPNPYLYTEACRNEFRDIVLRILDGLELQTTKFVVEPWHNSFFYQPEEIRAFIDSIGHPAFGLHLDVMNMVSQRYFYDTTSLIHTTFDLLAPHAVSAHLKDLNCDARHQFLKWDEVFIGDGVLDYPTYLTRLAALPEDTPCFCEHLAEERDYALNFARLHRLASNAGVPFRRRTPISTRSIPM